MYITMYVYLQGEDQSDKRPARMHIIKKQIRI